MKKILLYLIISCVAVSSFSFEQWEIYTNNSHIYKTMLSENNLISASWGGIEVYEIDFTADNISLELIDKYATINGLVSNEVRELYLRGDKIWAGTYSDGVTILDNDGQYILNTANGLISNKIKHIESGEELIFVVTDGGLSAFYDLDEIAFPILYRRYSNASTLEALLSDNINDFIIHEGYIYIATDEGINYVEENSIDDYDSWHSLTTNNSELATNKVQKLCFSNDKLVVAGPHTIQTLSNLFSNPIWETFSVAEPTVDYPFITALSGTPQGDILYSTGSWDEEITTMSELSSTILYKLTSQGEIKPLLTTATSISKINSNNSTPFHLNKVGIKNIEQRENKLILSTWGSGILIYHNNRWFQYEPNGIGFNAINHLTIDQNNHLWASCGYYGISALRKGARGVSSFDGENWATYNMANSPLQSDNINSITVGTDNKKWFGSWYAAPDHAQNWRGGMTSFDEASSKWRLYHSTGVFDYSSETDSYSERVSSIAGLPSQTVAYLNTDMQGNIIASLQGYGIAFYSPTGAERVAISPLYGSSSNFTRLSFHNEFGYFFSKSAVAAVGESAGLLHWNSHTLPQEGNISDWEIVPIPDLRASAINDLITVPTSYGSQMWVAANSGLFMYDGSSWYRYGIDIKRERWSSGWKVDIRYFVGEPKLFAAKETFPTALAFDGDGNLWIGSDNAGITRYNIKKEEYFTYEQDSYPLISNQITALAYEPHAGKLYIGASEGLCSVTVGSTINTQEKFEQIVVSPNPFYPERGDVLRIFNHPENVMPRSSKRCKIYDISGQLVYDLPLDKYQSFSWNGNNKDGKKCSSGIYFYTISNDKGETKRGKIALIRD